jgi:Methylase involved in ubiquinone/menaquinone biosynthesis
MNTQKDAFLEYEGDNWFRRNQEALRSNPEDDVALRVMKEYSVSPRNVFEIGCSTGYRLDAIASAFENVQVTGLEPSGEAIRYGKEHYPRVHFIKGTADDMVELPSQSFDVVIIGFVLYVIDRELLLKVIAETDRLLSDGGLLMIIDFFSEKPIRNSYDHIKDRQAFAFKQNYHEIFMASHLYHLIDRRTMDHSRKGYDLSGDFYDKYALTTLKKDLCAGYHQRT